MGFKTSIATVSISGALSDKLRAIAEAGYGGAEIFENDLLSAPESAREIGALMRELDLACTMFQPFRDLEGLPDDLRARAFERMKRKFDVMEQLGTDLVLLCSNCSPHAMDDRGVCSTISTNWARWPPPMASAWAMRRWRGGAMWLITATVGRWFAMWITRPSDLCWTGSIRWPAASLRPVLATFAPKAVHCSGGRRADAGHGLSQLVTPFPLYAGSGRFPLAEWAAAIARTGYDGWWSLEIFNDRFRAGSAHQVARMGIGPCACWRIRRRVCSNALAHAAAHRAARRRIHRICRQPRGSRGFWPRVPRFGLCPGGPASVQGRDPLGAGRHQPCRQFRTRRSGAQL
jgi:4-hydroxyphenylpyruvate dioxygenase